MVSFCLSIASSLLNNGMVDGKGNYKAKGGITWEISHKWNWNLGEIWHLRVPFVFYCLLAKFILAILFHQVNSGEFISVLCSPSLILLHGYKAYMNCYQSS
ncbi:hypothetical protein AAHE18_03G141700 [Arachis hypogaea]